MTWQAIEIALCSKGMGIMQSNYSKRSAAFRARGIAALWAVVIMVAAGGGASAAPVETVLHSFAGAPGDGANPSAGLIADSKGNLFGTTVLGGAFASGVVFKLAPGGSETVLYSFTGGSDGAGPAAGLIADSSGNLYGTASGGGASNAGVVFKLGPGGTETVLHSFTGGSDRASSVAGLIADGSGNLYGTTEAGGRSGSGCIVVGCGVVFKLGPDGTETVLHAFTGSDGANPQAGLIADGSGNLYGTTYAGGGSNAGVVFKLSPSGTETVLYTFTGGSDGGFPLAGLIADSSGNLYGTTAGGGAQPPVCGGGGCGVVFKLSPSGTETVLYSFT
jgi:uncharacterized repeat protein (TIGR03803 family)